MRNGGRDLDALAHACRNGDESALTAVLAEVRPAVLRFLVAQGIPLDDVEDVAQEVCMAVAQTLPSWHVESTSVWAFVFTVLRRRLVDSIRSQERAARRGQLTWTGELPDAVEPSAGPEDVAGAKDQLRRLRAPLDALPASQRDVLLLRVVVGLSVAETAQALGLARGSVHVLQHRAVKALRAVLDPSLVHA